MWVEPNGKTWRIRDLVARDKVTVASGFPNKTLANNRRKELEVDRLRGDALVHRGGEVALDDWIDLWWPSYEATLKPSAQVSSRGLLSRYIRPMLGKHRLDDLGALTVQRWIADLRAGRTHVKKPRPLSRKTATNAHGLLHKILAEAVTAKLIKTNPCASTKFGQKQHHEMTFLTEQEADRLLKAMPAHYRPLVLLLLTTGLRWGEAVGLRVKDVDVLGGKLRVVKNLQELADTAAMVEAEPKSGMSRRSVSFTKDLADELVALVGVDKQPDDRVFLAPKGGLVRYRVFWPVFHRARLAAGVPACRIHDLRHTHAAWLIASNIPLTAIQRRLGHSSIRVTSDLYGHMMPEIDDKIVTALEARLPKIGFRGPVGESAGQLKAIEGDSARPEAGQGALSG